MARVDFCMGWIWAGSEAPPDRQRAVIQAMVASIGQVANVVPETAFTGTKNSSTLFGDVPKPARKD